MASPVDSCDYLPFFLYHLHFFLVVIIMLLYAFYHHYRFHHFFFHNLITNICLSNYGPLLRTHSFIYDFPYTGYPHLIFYHRRLCSCSSLFIFSSSLFLFFFSSCSPCHLPSHAPQKKKKMNGHIHSRSSNVSYRGNRRERPVYVAQQRTRNKQTKLTNTRPSRDTHPDVPSSLSDCNALFQKA